jgi:hypothetical protein
LGRLLPEPNLPVTNTAGTPIVEVFVGKPQGVEVVESWRRVYPIRQREDADALEALDVLQPRY